MYCIAITIEGFEKRRRSSGLLHILVGFFLIAKAADYYRYLFYENLWPVIPFILVGAVSLFYGFFRKRYDITARFNFWLRLIQAITFALFGFLMMDLGHTVDYAGLFLWAVLAAILMFSERRVFNVIELQLTEQGILIPGFYRDHLVAWADLTEVVIRQDYITIFHHDKKFLQYRVDQTLSDLELAKLNAFCREQLEKVKEEQKANA